MTTADHLPGKAAPRFLLLDDVAEELSTSRAQVYAMVRGGELPAIKVGGRAVQRLPPPTGQGESRLGVPSTSQAHPPQRPLPAEIRGPESAAACDETPCGWAPLAALARDRGPRSAIIRHRVHRLRTGWQRGSLDEVGVGDRRADVACGVWTRTIPSRRSTSDVPICRGGRRLAVALAAQPQAHRRVRRAGVLPVHLGKRPVATSVG